MLTLFLFIVYSFPLDWISCNNQEKGECSNISYKSVGSPKDLIFLSNLLIRPSNFGISDKIMNDEAHQGVAASEADANVSLHEKWSIFAMALSDGSSSKVMWIEHERDFLFHYWCEPKNLWITILPISCDFDWKTS